MVHRDRELKRQALPLRDELGRKPIELKMYTYDHRSRLAFDLRDQLHEEHSMFDASRYLKGPTLAAIEPKAVFYYQRHQAWELRVKDADTAVKIAARAHKDLVSKTKLTAADQHFHHRKLYVSYPDGVVEHDGLPEAKRNTEKADLKYKILLKGEETFGKRGVKLTGAEGAYKLAILPVRKELRGKFSGGAFSAATLQELDQKLDDAIGKVQHLL